MDYAIRGDPAGGLEYFGDLEVPVIGLCKSGGLVAAYSPGNNHIDGIIGLRTEFPMMPSQHSSELRITSLGPIELRRSAGLEAAHLVPEYVGACDARIVRAVDSRSQKQLKDEQNTKEDSQRHRAFDSRYSFNANALFSCSSLEPKSSVVAPFAVCDMSSSTPA